MRKRNVRAAIAAALCMTVLAAGTPKRYPVFPTTMLTNSKIEPMSRMFSAVKIISNEY